MLDRTKISNIYAIYCLFDLDGNPAYVGRSSEVKTRLGQHFENRTSSIAGDGRLDPWDIQEVYIWYIDRLNNSESDGFSKSEMKRISNAAEDDIKSHFKPYLDHAGLNGATADVNIEPADPDQKQSALTQADRKFRRHPFNRMSRKLTHVNNLIEIIRSVNNPEKQLAALEEHWRILEESKDEFVDSDERDFNLLDFVNSGNNA